MATTKKIFIDITGATGFAPEDKIVLCGTDNPNLPKEQWPELAVVPPDTTIIEYDVVPGFNIFAVKGRSAYWGADSPLSAAESTPAIPSASGITLKLRLS